jgi:hypothetical protein
MRILPDSRFERRRRDQNARKLWGPESSARSGSWTRSRQSFASPACARPPERLTQPATRGSSQVVAQVAADFANKSAKCWSEWQDLNLRPPRTERGALPLASRRQWGFGTAPSIGCRGHSTETSIPLPMCPVRCVTYVSERSQILDGSRQTPLACSGQTFRPVLFTTRSFCLLRNRASSTFWTATSSTGA